MELVKVSGQKDSVTFLKQKIFHEIQNLSEQIICYDLTYYIKSKESSPKYFSGLKISIKILKRYKQKQKSKESLNQI